MGNRISNTTVYPIVTPARNDITISTDISDTSTDAGGETVNFTIGAILDTEQTNANITGGSISGITDLAIADGGTGSSTASAARNALGLAIGTDVQAWDADLDTWATKTAPTGAVIGTTDTQTLTNKTLTSPSLTGDTSIVELTETVYNLTGTSIDPANGTIQYKTLTANTTLTEALENGQSVTLRLAAGATYTVTWPTMTWVGGSAPTLTADDVLVIWQEGATVYGQYVGSVA